MMLWKDRRLRGKGRHLGLLRLWGDIRSTNEGVGYGRPDGKSHRGGSGKCGQVSARMGWWLFPKGSFMSMTKKLQFDLGEKKEFYFFSSFSTFTLFL